MAAVFGISDVISALTRPGYVWPWYGYLFLVTAALLNRGGRYGPAAVLTITMFPLVTFATVLSGSNPGTAFPDLIVGVILASILLERQGAMIFNLACFLSLLSTPWLIPQFVPSLGTILSPLILVAIGSGLSLVLMIHRHELERDRQAALRASEERLLLALDASHMGTWEWDTASREVHASERAVALFGLLPNTFDGTTGGYVRAVHPDDLAAVEKELTDVLSGGKQDFEIVHRVVWPGGSTHWIQVEGRSTRSAHGARRVNGTVLDVTDRKLAGAERDRLIRELEEKNAELERFTYTVSHDLKTPLITIRGFLGSIDRDVRDGRVDRLSVDVERVLNATAGMQRLLDELLKLSRIGRITNPPERVAFAEVVREAMDLVHGRLEASHARVEIQDDLPEVFGDRSRLVQVVQNLLDNAAKFLGDQKNPRIVIGSRPSTSDGRPVFYVRDNGIGVDPAHLQKVVGLFEKLDNRIDGTGVGLAIVKRIVEVHGGQVWVESLGRDQGTTVCFTLLPPPTV